MALKHKHLIISLQVKYPPKDYQEVEAFQSFLIKRIGMNIAKADTLPKNPMAYFCENPGNIGVTGVGILETSHTVIHVWEESFPAKMEFDLYSCSDFEVEHIISLMHTFGIIKGNFYVLDRDEGLVIIDSGVINENGDITERNTLTKEKANDDV